MPVPAEPAAQQPTIQFVANGRVAGTDGCNRVSAPYTLNGERITFGPMIATRMACPGIRRGAAALRGGPGGHHRVAHRRRTPRVLRRDRQAAGDLRGAAAGRDAAGGRAAPLKSKVFDWASLTAAPIPNGERRAVLDGPTETVDLLHVHVTTLAPGKISGPPVRHLQEEVLIVKDGEVEVSLDGTTQKAGAGSILFFAAGAVTGLRNVSSAPATYYVIYYKTPKTPKS